MPARNACGVCTATSPTRSTVAVTRTSSTRFNVSVTASPGTAPSAPLAHRGDHRLEERGRGQRARRVVHDHDLGIAGDTAANPARTDAARVAPPVTSASTSAPCQSSASGTTRTTASHAAGGGADRVVDEAHATELARTAWARRSAHPSRRRR